MRHGVVGSRDFPDMDKVRGLIASLADDTTVISGGARGVDMVAELAARARGLPVKIHLPDWFASPRGAGMIRNQKIVDDSDRLTAFWDGHSRGTADTIKRAKVKGIPVEIVTAEKP